MPEDSGWFGGHAADIRGECSCERGWWWDGWMLECWEGDTGNRLPVWAWILITVGGFLVVWCGVKCGCRLLCPEYWST